MDEPDSRFRTYAKLPKPDNPEIHHTRVSVKQEDGRPPAIATKDFADETTPHWNSDDCVALSELGELITALQMIRREYES
jgi:hypothetical protein